VRRCAGIACRILELEPYLPGGDVSGVVLSMNDEEIRFGRYRLHLGRRELSRDGTPLQLSSRALEILCALAAAKGDVVTKDDLIAKAWPGTIVEENNLQVQVSALRKALDEDSGGQVHLVTVQGRGYRLVGLEVAPQSPTSVPRDGLHIGAEKPSIAVLPFQNLSGDPEQEYFADGMVEDIITALSRMRWLFVIARNSCFTYKDRRVAVTQVGHELGVRYVLEGSVRKAGQRVRISGQLMDGLSGGHLWADRFDGGLEDIFDLQDSVTASVVGAIAPKLEQAEIERAKRKPTDNLDAYDFYLRGMAGFHKWTRKGMTEALGLFYKAIELDPEFAAAYGMAAWSFVPRRTNAWMTDVAKETAEAGRLARLAIQFGKEDAVALNSGGYALANVVEDLDAGAALIDRALTLNPNLAAAWHNSGWVRVYLGEPEAAIEHIKNAIRMSPLDPLLFGMYGAIAFAHYFAGRYDEASTWADKSVREQPWGAGLVIAAASKAQTGRVEDARRILQRFGQRDTGYRISQIHARTPLRRLQDIDALADGLRRAGLSE
jgi:TolB-like protein/tetratricopeptide (TPR) repeat protein